MARSCERQISLPIASEHVAQRALQVVGSMKGASNVYLHPPRVTGTIGMGIASWGERISVLVQDAPGGCTAVVRSECVFPLQLIDMGKNRKNVEHVVAGLTPTQT